jgi:hypothetical protein
MINFTQKLKDLGPNNKKVSIRMKNSIEPNAERPTREPNIVPPASESLPKQWGYKLRS